MSIRLRYLAGGTVGIIIGLLLPLAGGDTLELLRQLSGLVVTIGRFFLFPLMFFGMIIAADELRSDENLLPLAGRTVVWTLLAVVVSTLAGVLSVAVLAPQRIPPMIQEGQVAQVPSLLGEIAAGLRGNLFQVFVLNENAVAGVLLVGLLIGVSLHYDRSVTSPVSLVADSANRILYRLNSQLVEFLGVLLIVPMAATVVLLREVPDLELFLQFLLVSVVAVLVVGFLLFPLIIFLLDRKRARPLGWLRSMITPVVPALVSGDSYFALGTLIRTGKEELDIHRKVGATVLPAVSLYGRAGSAMISIAGFLLVIRSYTALEIGVGDLIELSVAAMVYSFFLARVPAGRVALLLSYLALRYGRGMEESYLILLPVMPILERIGAVLDVMTAGFVAQVVKMRTLAAAEAARRR